MISVIILFKIIQKFVATVQVMKNPHIFCFMEKPPCAKSLNFREKQLLSREKFQGEIAEFLSENMELYRQNLKISGRNRGISWRNFPLFLPEKKAVHHGEK